MVPAKVNSQGELQSKKSFYSKEMFQKRYSYSAYEADKDTSGMSEFYVVFDSLKCKPVTVRLVAVI